jgi:glycerol uptake facilitator-like aquaporin
MRSSADSSSGCGVSKIGSGGARNLAAYRNALPGLGVEGCVSERHGWVSILLAVPGICACAVAIFGFFRKIVTNGLPYRPGLSASEHYQAVGESYSNGFLTGFFLCFFLVLAVLAAGTLAARRRRPHHVQRPEAARTVAFPGKSA